MRPKVGSITHYVNQLQAGDPQAVYPLWEHFYDRLVELARFQLQGKALRIVNEEDLAVNVLEKLCVDALAGKLPLVKDRDHLWRLLVCIIKRRIIDQRRRASRKKRGGGEVRGESWFTGRRERDGEQAGLDGVAGPAYLPEFQALMADELERLGDATLREVALLWMAGHNRKEIAARVGCAPRSVDRKLQLIRAIWKEDLT